MTTADTTTTSRHRQSEGRKAVIAIVSSEDDPDRIPQRVNFARRLRPEWEEPGRPAWSLRMELSDIRSRPELLDDGDHRFLAWVGRHAIRGNEVWLSKLQSKRLQGLALRWLNPSETAAWSKRQREAGASVEAALSDAA